ncbi:Lon-like protease helical domain-containing protein, partial [Clostridioides difficile]|uniref:Lon-like protease helical domain-containing protein n=1 Tax=Clostridioides difficile TaxID=1496 RepID=UPI001F4679C1
PGTGKSTYSLKVLNEYASKKNTHKDWCYIYNFENPREPIIVEGKEIKMELTIGDKVIFQKYSGTEVKIEGQEYTILRQSDV